MPWRPGAITRLWLLCCRTWERASLALYVTGELKSEHKSVYRVTFKYSQKLKKTKEKFGNAFARHLGGLAINKLNINGNELDFRSCILEKY